MTDQRKTELEICIRKMRAVSDVFYSQATQCGNHSFIEFCGFMNEYIKICEQSLAAGIEFDMASTHTGQGLVVHDHNLKYLAEKFDCIFGPTMNDQVTRRKFLEHLGWV